ncbi:unnamed protein product [Prorocentrum cordatum]|uniref:Apple domain-containing protein n=1 Tax=Prorocentrum cordatum TaxID=2364126 RepID=A0ABN9WHN8_9DINO|nr:unnamed protein product [Polarella glacialis]
MTLIEGAASTASESSSSMHSYDYVGDGGCQDDAGRHMDSYRIVSAHLTPHFCQSHCDADADCVAYTAAPGNCTVWGPDESAVMVGWYFQKGDGATNVTRGQSTSHDRGQMTGLFHVVETDAEVFCMVKSTRLTAASVEGEGAGFWVFELILPVLLVCGALVAMMMCRRGGKKRSDPENEPLAHQKPAHETLPASMWLSGKDKRTTEKPSLGAMSDRPTTPTGDV